MTVTVCMAAVPFFGNNYFYFSDDFQTMIMPVMLEIARQVKEWQIPLVTGRSWLGGAISAEYQYAIWNPVSVSLYVLMDRFGRLDQAAAFFSIFHLGLLSAGIFALCRGLGIPRAGAVAAALAGGTGMWVVYWGQAWVNALVGIAWLPWASAALLLAYRRTLHVGPAAVATALALVSGWPYTAIALILGAGLGLATSLALTGRFLPCLRVVLAMGLGGAVAAPAFLPLLYFLLDASMRSHGASAGVLTAHFETLAAVSLPVFPNVLKTFGGVDRISPSPPIHYVSWFILPVLANANWAILKERRGGLGLGLVLVAAAFGLLSMYGAGWYFRWPFRLLPYYHITLAVLAGWLMTRTMRDGQGAAAWGTGRTALAFAVPLVLGLFNQPTLGLDQAVLLSWICVLVLLTRQLQRSWPDYWIAVPVIGHVTVFIYLTSIFPHNDLVPRWTPPVERQALPGITEAPGVRRLALYQPPGRDASFGSGKALDDAFWSEIMPGNTPLHHDVEAINGYSALDPRGLRQAFCMDYIGASCPDAAKRILSPDGVTGLSLLDLTRVDRVVAQRGLHADRFASAAGGTWVRAGSGKHSDVFVRREPLPERPGSVSVQPPDMRLRLVGRLPDRESYHLDRGHGGGRIIWARAWYPGYRAFLAGRPLEVEPVLGLLPSVVLPPGEGGELVLDYVPAGLRSGLAIAGVALGLAGALSLGCLFRGRNGRRLARPLLERR
ncbi:hypothetical protein JL100_030930 (plasmid) [Skermanella mucosa]|uniref:hypothetical protein n=1 Tax=Skermanella mucosa TaxID=1789672 RepID=UPI00192B89EA|nr:hypothetical protein [Skermanella mucosa]UEM24623.1 hypothetical protein JL100_030930 [Skermanella mucosa]